MNTQTTQKSLPIYRGELALLLAVAINSFGVVLMLYFRDRNFRYFQCSLRFFLRLSEDKPWNMDLHISGTSGTGADDPAEKIRSPVSIQLRSRIRFRGAA